MFQMWPFPGVGRLLVFVISAYMYGVVAPKNLKGNHLRLVGEREGGGSEGEAFLDRSCMHGVP